MNKKLVLDDNNHLACKSILVNAMAEQVIGLNNMYDDLMFVDKPLQVASVLTVKGVYVYVYVYVCVCMVCVCMCVVCINLIMNIIENVVIFRFAGVRKSGVLSQVCYIDKLTFDVALQFCGHQYPYFMYIYYVSFISCYERRICALVCCVCLFLGSTTRYENKCYAGNFIFLVPTCRI